MRVLSLFPHPDAAAANLSRLIPSRMARNTSFRLATSAIWKTIFREWRTTFALILNLIWNMGRLSRIQKTDRHFQPDGDFAGSQRFLQRRLTNIYSGSIDGTCVWGHM